MPAIPSDAQFITPTGDLVFLGTSFSSAEKGGVGVLVAAASVSFLAIVGLFIILGVSTYKTMRTPSQHRFVRNHVVAYFVSLLLCDFISANGALLNGRWIGLGGIQIGAFCTAQGALKNVGNVGTALWSMILAVHTFCLIVLKWRARDLVLYVTLLVTWAFIALVVIIGPSAVQNITTQGPYFGVAGPWCWITENYAVQRFTLGYFWMFLSALVSFALYSVVFFHLRGNLIINGRQVRLRLRNPTPAWEAQTGKNSVNNPPIGPAKQMLMYPIAYTILVLPIAFCRFLEWAGHDVSFGAIMLADTIFLLSGFVNVVLFTTTRTFVSIRQARALFSRDKSRDSDRDLETLKTSASPPGVPSETEKISPSLIPTPHMVTPLLTVPLPAQEKLTQGRKLMTQRGTSRAPTVVSNYSQDSGRNSPASFSSVPFRLTKISSIKKALLRGSDTPKDIVKEEDFTDVDLSSRDDCSDYSKSRFSHSSTTSMTPLRPPPRPRRNKSEARPTPHKTSPTSSMTESPNETPTSLPSRLLPTVTSTLGPRHSKKLSAQSSSRPRAPGTPF